MNQKKTFLAIIPARGGSKRIPKKNIISLGEKPLIAWTIDAAKNCKYLDEIMVTTDDPEIRKIAISYGASAPFLRPQFLASDTATSYDTIKHTIDFYKESQNRDFDFIVLLQPTSPFRTGQQITESVVLLKEKNASSIVSVCKAEHSPLWMNSLPEDGNMNNFIRNEFKKTRSQDLIVHYRLNGAIYICETNKLLAEESFFIKSNSFAYVMSRESSLDIDEPIDFRFAEFLVAGISENSQ